MCGGNKLNYFTLLIVLSSLYTASFCSENSIYRARYHGHQNPAYKQHRAVLAEKSCDKEKDLEISNQFAQTLTHEKIKNSKFEPYDEREVDQRNEDEDYEILSSKVARSADDNNGEKCDDANGQDKRNDYMDSWGSNKGTGSMKKTTNIALKAAQEAKAAEEAQEGAGKQASKQAKVQLAEKAIQAAKAAQAALSAKQAINDEMERELREAEMVVQDLSSSIQQSEANSNAALRAYQQAQSQLKMMSEVLTVAQSTVGNAEQAAQGSQQELNEKTQLLEAAKNRVEKLLRELKTARTDFTNTKKEAYKASMAAKEAKQNAARV